MKQPPPPPPPPPIFRADLRRLPKEERERYMEVIWRRCEKCGGFGGPPDNKCTKCFGRGTYMRVQHSAQVIDATDRLEENGDPW